MKAIVYHRYGGPDVLRCEEVEKPVPGDDDVLIQVRAASINPIDWHFLRGEPRLFRLITGLRKPKLTRLGVDVAGVIESAGRNVTQLKPGDEVFGSCRGSCAEYASTAQSAVTVKPKNATFEQAAALPVAALTALQALRHKARLQSGQKVLINGAAGGVGTFAVQIAKSLGAVVAGVCSTGNVEMVRAIGADHVIDYTREDFTESAERYDLIFDCIGNRPLSAVRRVMARKGMYVVVGGPVGRWIAPMGSLLKMMLVSPFISQRLVPFVARNKNEDLIAIRELMESGKVAPVVGRRYSLADAPKAIAHSESGHASGKIVIAI